MKISCNRRKLLETFKIAESITPSKTSKPILKNIKLEASGDTATVTATNIEMTMKRTIEAGSVGEKGTALIAGREMAEILRETDSEDVFITVEGNTVIVKAGEDKFTIQSNISEEFFNVEEVTDGFNVIIEKERLSRMIRKTAFTSGKETMAYNFNGILFKVKDDTLEVVGSDGKRIAIANETCKESADEEFSSLVPVSTLRVLSNVLAISEDTEITINLSDNHIIISDSSTELTSQLLEGKYPEYENYIPKEFNLDMSMNRDELESSVRKADIMTSQETHLVKFIFSTDDKTVTMKSKCLDRGTSEITMAIESAEGSDMTVGFNARHILEALKILDNPELSWRIKEDPGPGEFREEGYQYVFMPVKMK